MGRNFAPGIDTRPWSSSVLCYVTFSVRDRASHLPEVASAIHVSFVSFPVPQWEASRCWWECRPVWACIQLWAHPTHTMGSPCLHVDMFQRTQAQQGVGRNHPLQCSVSGQLAGTSMSMCIGRV